MSKPKHYMRGMGYYVGYGYTSIQLKAQKGACKYEKFLREEISGLILKSRGNSSRIAKLRKYLKRAS